MKYLKITNYRLTLLISLILMFFSGCMTENDETIALKEVNNSKLSSFINADGNTVFVITGTEGKNAYIAIPNGENLDKMNVVFGNSSNANSENGTVIFSNGKVRSITIRDITYTFHQNNNGYVHVAITSGNITELFRNVGTAIDNTGSVWQRSFSDIYSYIQIVMATNSKVSTTSQLYTKIQEIIALLNLLYGDTGELSNNSTADQLAEDALNGTDDGDIDETGIQQNEESARDNTDIGNGAIASGIGALKVTLTWKFSADIDVHIYEPGFSGTIPSTSNNKGHIYYHQKANTFTDGYLDIDNTVGYYINPSTRETNTRLAAMENVYWPNNPKNGLFYVYLHHFSGSASGNCNVTIYLNGITILSKTVYVSKTSDHNTQKFIAKISMPSGTIYETRACDDYGEKSDYIDFSRYPIKLN